ncbi:hypothetical protein [Streptomyces microflavus]|uniref:hypothetical protein n=1 Tax=Streptomyces microflavus TaxID=1919 RepID=UPI003B226818
MPTDLTIRTYDPAGHLGRHQALDPRSLAYRRPYDGQPLRPTAWEPRIPVLDQRNLIAQGILTSASYGLESDVDALASCTGQAATALLSILLTPEQATGAGLHTSSAVAAQHFAIGLYADATAADRWMEHTWPTHDTGSSGLGVAKAMRNRGLIDQYGHATTAEELCTLLQTGPVLLGLPWCSAFTDTSDAHGFIDADPDWATSPWRAATRCASPPSRTSPRSMASSTLTTPSSASGTPGAHGGPRRRPHVPAHLPDPPRPDRRRAAPQRRSPPVTTTFHVAVDHIDPGADNPTPTTTYLGTVDQAHVDQVRAIAALPDSERWVRTTPPRRGVLRAARRRRPRRVRPDGRRRLPGLRARPAAPHRNKGGDFAPENAQFVQTKSTASYTEADLPRGASGPAYISGVIRMGGQSIGGAMDTPGNPPRFTWHSTESPAGGSYLTSISAYLIRVGAESQVVYDPITDGLVQLGPLTKSGRALRNDGSRRTNREGKVNIQVEVLGKASQPWTKGFDPAKKPNYRKLLAAGRAHGIPDTWRQGSPRPPPQPRPRQGGTATRGSPRAGTSPTRRSPATTTGTRAPSTPASSPASPRPAAATTARAPAEERRPARTPCARTTTSPRSPTRTTPRWPPW